MHRLSTYSILLIITASILLSCSRDREFPVTTSSPEARALYWEAAEAARNIENHTARILLNSAIEFDSTFALAYSMRASTSKSPTQDLEKARRFSEHVTEDERTIIEASYHQVLHDWDTALRLLNKLIEKYPDELNLRLQRMGILLSVDVERGLAELQELSKEFPGSPAVHNSLGYAYLRTGDIESAERHFDYYIKLAPHLANPYDSMGDFLREQGRYQEAIGYYEQAMERDVSRSSLEKLVLCHAYLQQFDQAWRALDRSSPIVGDEPIRLHSIQTKLNLMQGNTEEAIEHMRKQIDAAYAADDYEVFSSTSGQLAAVLIYHGRIDRGLEVLDSTDEFLRENVSGPMDINYVWDDNTGIRAYAYAKRGDIERARDTLKMLKNKIKRYKTPDERQAGRPLQTSQASVSVNLFGPSASNRPEVKKETAEIYYQSLKQITQFWEGMLAYMEGDFDESCDLLRPIKNESSAASFWLAKAEMERGNAQIARAVLSTLASSGSMDGVFALVFPEMQDLLKELSS